MAGYQQDTVYILINTHSTLQGPKIFQVSNGIVGIIQQSRANVYFNVKVTSPSGQKIVSSSKQHVDFIRLVNEINSSCFSHQTNFYDAWGLTLNEIPYDEDGTWTHLLLFTNSVDTTSIIYNLDTLINLMNEKLQRNFKLRITIIVAGVYSLIRDAVNSKALYKDRCACIAVQDTPMDIQMAFDQVKSQFRSQFFDTFQYPNESMMPKPQMSMPKPQMPMPQPQMPMPQAQMRMPQPQIPMPQPQLEPMMPKPQLGFGIDPYPSYPAMPVPQIQGHPNNFNTTIADIINASRGQFLGNIATRPTYPITPYSQSQIRYPPVDEMNKTLPSTYAYNAPNAGTTTTPSETYYNPPSAPPVQDSQPKSTPVDGYHQITSQYPLQPPSSSPYFKDNLSPWSPKPLSATSDIPVPPPPPNLPEYFLKIKVKVRNWDWDKLRQKAEAGSISKEFKFNIWAGNIPEVGQRQVLQYFQQWGSCQIESLNGPADAQWAVISYENEASVEYAVQFGSGSEFRGQNVIIHRI